MDDIAEMVMDLTVALPKFESYTVIIPEAFELNEPLREMYESYVNCCIEAIFFLKKNRFTDIQTRNAQEHLPAQNIRNCGRYTPTSIEAHTKGGRGANAGSQIAAKSKFSWKGEVLIQLDSYMRRSNDPRCEEKMPSSCVLHGIGGVGKTQVALQYLYRHEKDYEYIFWVNSETGPNIIEKFHDFAQVLMPDQVSKNQASSVDLMRHWFKKNSSWLIIFDNAEDLGVFSYWPPCAHGSIVVTTQKMTLSQMASADIHLDGLAEDDGCEVILKHIYHQRISERTDVDKATAKSISKELGGLPILLSHVAGFASHSRCPLADLLALLQEPSSLREIWEYDSQASSNFQYGAPMSKVWGLALQEL
ncbi:hypothetical protein DL98DRAFT_623568 [Cadophora sp. DSE1049]|nr:hypothetical protein DL98DRAFT_623568 [Cadophora sp. DSE1049]